MLIVVIWLYLGSETLHVLISVVSYLMLQQNAEWFDILIPAYPCYPENWLLNGCIGNVVDIRICLHLFFGVFTLPLTTRLCFPLSVCMSLSNMSQMLIADISAICELCIWEQGTFGNFQHFIGSSVWIVVNCFAESWGGATIEKHIFVCCDLT